MNTDFKSSKNKNRQSMLMKKLNFKERTNYDDIIPYDDMNYYEEYEDVIINNDMLSEDKIKLSNDFYYNDDVINYFD